uniref:G-protein coupled receptors family 1 profile domain-containing protein n=1 Tax=Sus scrofa TaxID=9823 RepID=A0A4X1VAS5_PIG
MEKNNHKITEFILVGFTTDPVMQLVLFVVFLGVYSGTVLHTPMYFFIGNLSFLDLWYSSVYTPKILVTCISEDKTISFAGCAAQFFFSGGLGYSECYLLAAMACDYYMPISKPLLYSQAMSVKLCAFFVAASYLGGFINCYQALMYFLLASNVITPAMLILASYLFIITTILRICSTQGRLKAFSTCSSQLISVTLCYGSILYIYSHPRLRYSSDRDKIVSTFYTVIVPMLNPMIYSLRNKDVKEALNKLFK